jgi:hypothetical protein
VTRLALQLKSFCDCYRLVDVNEGLDVNRLRQALMESRACFGESDNCKRTVGKQNFGNLQRKKAENQKELCVETYHTYSQSSAKKHRPSKKIHARYQLANGL